MPNGDKITIAQLSEMRSGLYSYSFDAGFNKTPDESPQKVWTPEELLAIAFSHPVNFAPRAKYEYSNTNIILLRLVIEKLTGTTASQAFQDRIFTPARPAEHLASIARRRLDSPPPRARIFVRQRHLDHRHLRAAGRGPTGGARGQALCCRTTRPMPTLPGLDEGWTAGGAISTVDDMKTYVEALVDGGLLDAATQRIRMDTVPHG